MRISAEKKTLVNVRGTRLLTTDTRERYRQKIARITLDSMVQFVGLLDAEGTVLEINHVALDAVGVALDEVEGRPFWTTFWWQVSPEINAGLREMIHRAAAGEFVRWDTEIYGRAGGKETIIIDASLMPVKDEDGTVVFITAEGRDITEKKAYEREIAKKSQDLQVLLERVRELDEIKTQFFANVSHELRTPLQLIIGPADRLARDNGSMTPAQRDDSARVIGRNARMLLRHVNDLLDISKFEAGKLKIDLRDTDLAALVRLTASNFEVLAAERDVRLTVDAAGEVIVAFDGEKIQRALMNLLSNAFKFVPAGGRVSVSLGDSELDGTVALTVGDSGPGVRPELRTAIFERFRQGDGGMAREVGGTGLGLAIVKEFAEMHGGAVDVSESALGGAEFRIVLPRRRLSPDAPPARAVDALDHAVVEGFIEELRPVARVRESVDAGARHEKPVVLVVEDNPEMNRFVAESLVPEYRVVTAHDGEEGLAQALRHAPALIVSDIMMPRVSGVQLVADIRRHRELADVPILLLSAKADEELKVELLENGAQDFIAKPFSERDLQVRVRNLLELRRNQERHRTLFRSMDEGFCIIEVIFDDGQRPVDYQFLEVNNAFEKQTGVKHARGRRMREIAPDLESHWFETFGRIALTGASERFESPAAQLGRWFEVYAFRVGAPENRQVATFFSDISARKSIESSLTQTRNELATANAQLARTNEELEDRVVRRTASLSDAVAQLEEFSYTVSHDLRAPLRGMQAYSEALLEEFGDVFAERPEAVDYIRRIAANAERLDRMVRDVLSFSRLGKHELPLARVATDALVRSLVDLHPAFRPPASEIRIEPLHDVLGHETALTQAISNLLANAVKFVPAETRPRIRVWSERVDGDVRIWIEDNGIGIDPALHHRLFRMFERIDPESAYEGTGVGLAVVRKALDRMHGTVGLESDGVTGCRFWIQLRAAE